MRRQRYLVASSLSCVLVSICSFLPPSSQSAGDAAEHPDSTTVEIGPIDLDRPYRSMEGPGVQKLFWAGCFFSAKKISLPGSNCVRPDSSLLSAENCPPPALYWLRGARIETIDENGKVLPYAPFLCHADILVYRPGVTLNVTAAIADAVCLGSGLPRVQLPEGFAVPVTSRSRIMISVRALNRSLNTRKKIKFRLTVYSIKDQELKQPLVALTWSRADIIVLVKGARQPALQACCSEDCTITSTAEDTPIQWKRKIVRNNRGQTLSKHWSVPPGRHVYRDRITDERNPDFAGRGRIYAAWFHVHPYCESVSLVEHMHRRRRFVFTAHCQTATSPQPELRHVDYLTFPGGLTLNKKAGYELEGVYNNTSNSPQDAMVEAGMLFEDLNFRASEPALDAD